MTALAEVSDGLWPAEDVEARLDEVSRDVRRSMLAEIPDGVPHAWLYRVARDYPSRTGKAIRPALCLAACGAFGGDDASVRPIAVAIELLHNAFSCTTTSSTAASSVAVARRCEPATGSRSH